MASEGEIRQRFSQLEGWLDERSRRVWAAAESVAHGRGGISLVARASGVSRRAIAVGLAELENKPVRSQRTLLPVRRKGGGRKKAALKDPDLLSDLEKLLEPMTRGESAVAAALDLQKRTESGGGVASPGTQGQPYAGGGLLHQQKYSL